MGLTKILMKTLDSLAVRLPPFFLTFLIFWAQNEMFALGNN